MGVVSITRQNKKVFNVTRLMVVHGGVTIKILSEGLIYYRKRRSGSFYYIDYSENGGLTWSVEVILHADEDIIIITIDEAPAGYRELIRSGDYCIDHVLTPTGFDGIQNIDWENIYRIDK